MTTPFHPPQEVAPQWTVQTVGMSLEVLDRMEQAVAKVRERLLRATAALNRIGVPYAVVGGNAVAYWVATIDEGAVRTTRDVDLLVSRADLPAITAALEGTGFVSTPTRSASEDFKPRLRFALVFDELMDVVVFRDGAEGKPTVRLLFTGEKTRPDHQLPAPAIETVVDAADCRVVKLESLVQMKLTANRNADGMHLRDLIGVGLLDASWLPKLPPELAGRLQHLLDTPNG